MSKKLITFTFFLILGSAALGGFYIWRTQVLRVRAENLEREILKSLTAEEINLILKSQAAGDNSGVLQISEKSESRQLFLKGLREYLALAAQARREDLTEDRNFKINFEHKKNLLLADLYRTKLSGEQGKYYVVPRETLDEVWKYPENEEQFNIDMDTLRAIQAEVAKARGDQSVFTKLQGGALSKARENWANTKVLSEMAKRDAEFLSKPEINLRIKILEAGILSADYLRKHWTEKIKATPPEISEFLAAHPEYDVKKKRAKAESLLREILAGADFAKLAAEHSEDRSTKAKGGLYENVSGGDLWAEVEQGAFTLENGKIADRIIETNTGFHVVKLENKQTKKNADGSETIAFSVRHILLQKGFEDPDNQNPDIPPPFITAEEIAKNRVEKEKRDRLIAEIIGQNKISLPEDFSVELMSDNQKTPNIEKQNSAAIQ